MLIDKIEIKSQDTREYPFNLELFKKDIKLNTNSPVTLIVGENGSGKSSLVKLLQSKLKLVEIKLPNTKTLREVNSSSIKLTPSLGKLKGFYFESLTYIKYIEYIQEEIAYSKSEIERVDREYVGKSDYTKSLAKSPFARTIGELQNMYSRDLSEVSHGESYLEFFSSRIRENQIYLLDEPETPLSNQNQLSLLAMIMEATKKGCQFIISTHSPILTAFPEAIIYEIIDNEFIETKYEDIENIKFLKHFLNSKEQFLRHLL